MTNFDEIPAFEQYTKKFSLRKPAPKAPNFANLSDWITKLTWPVVLSQILLVALRTAGGFYNAAAAEYPGVIWYPAAISVFAFLGIELGVVIYAAHNARSNYTDGKTKRSGIMWVAILFGATISIAAGLEQSSALVADIAPWLREFVRWFMVLTQGIFATIFAVIGGHLIGENLAHMAILKEKGTGEYETNMTTWRESLYKSWTSSKEYKAVKGIATKKVDPGDILSKVKVFLLDERINPRTIKPMQLAYSLDITPSEAVEALKKVNGA